MTAPALPYLYRLTAPDGHEKLAALEFRALTGGEASRTGGEASRTGGGVARIAWAGAGVDIARAAYLGECCRLLASAPDIEGLLRATEKLALRRERFRVRVRIAPGAVGPGSQAIERMIADAVDGRPDLSRPACELIAYGEPDGWLLGELLSEAKRGWLGHEQRPHQFSAALPTRIARAMVNLVAAPGDTLLDPCCGVGTALIEAASMGIRAVGCEINPRLVEHAAGNLCHHMLRADLIAGDGRDVCGRFGGAVLDLPYGNLSKRDDVVCHGLVARAVEVARLVAVVTVEDLSDLLAELGAELLGVAEIAKGRLVRRVHWARGCVTME